MAARYEHDFHRALFAWCEQYVKEDYRLYFMTRAVKLWEHPGETTKHRTRLARLLLHPRYHDGFLTAYLVNVHSSIIPMIRKDTADDDTSLQHQQA